MCIICAKKRGVDMPDSNTIRNMFRHNPHGSGFMYARDGIVHIEKGFMTEKEFADITAQLEKLGVENPATFFENPVPSHYEAVAQRYGIVHQTF